MLTIFKEITRFLLAIMDAMPQKLMIWSLNDNTFLVVVADALFIPLIYFVNNTVSVSN